MSIDIVYFNTPQVPELEAKLSEYGELTAAVGEDRRSFLMALSEAVGRSDVIIAVGEVSRLASVLAKSLSLPLSAVAWNELGISGDSEVMLPQDALPLVVDGAVYGMLIENPVQCIIAVDNDAAVLEILTDKYITAYISAVSTQGSNETVNDFEEDDHPEIQPVEHFDGEDGQALDDDRPDLFADIEAEDFLIEDVRKRSKGGIIALIVTVAVIAVLAVAGWFGYMHWWVPRQYDEVTAAATESYRSGTLEIGSIPAEYALSFGSLYKQNDDIIGWISADGINISAPVVTEAGLAEGYYATHLFDGSYNKYGTAHIKYEYDTVSNVNPNLVIYGNNYGDGRAFSDVELLLDEDVAKRVALHTDSVFYGEDSWRILSVMVVDVNGSEYDYKDNFAGLSADERIERVNAALSLSKVQLGVSDADIAAIGLNDTFLTLVTPHSSEKDKAVVAVAMRIKSAEELYQPIIDEQPDGADDGQQPDGETSSDTESDVSEAE